MSQYEEKKIPEQKNNNCKRVFVFNAHVLVPMVSNLKIRGCSTARDEQQAYHTSEHKKYDKICVFNQNEREKNLINCGPMRNHT